MNCHLYILQYTLLEEKQLKIQFYKPNMVEIKYLKLKKNNVHIQVYSLLVIHI